MEDAKYNSALGVQNYDVVTVLCLLIESTKQDNLSIEYRLAHTTWVEARFRRAHSG
jgi:hypothetical protein